MDGVIVLDKPEGFTSFDAVAVVRGLAKERHIGHTGTLDPMATGVLPLLLGKATKAAPLLSETGKAYEAAFRLGEKRDTGDATGTVIAESGVRLEKSALEAALPKFRGDILQIPPMYSAVSVNGQRLYKLARQGVEVEREPRPITIEALELLKFDEAAQNGRLFVRCSKGTYIRTLIEDIAEAAGTVGTMTALRRTEACGFSLGDTVSLETLRAAEDISKLLRPVDRLFAGLPRVQVSEAQKKRYLNGGALDAKRCRVRGNPAENELAAICCGEDFLGVARLTNGELRYVRAFAEGN